MLFCSQVVTWIDNVILHCLVLSHFKDLTCLHISKAWGVNHILADVFNSLSQTKKNYGNPAGNSGLLRMYSPPFFYPLPVFSSERAAKLSTFFIPHKLFKKKFDKVFWTCACFPANNAYHDNFLAIQITRRCSPSKRVQK